jgi:CRISPR/Cas system-associated protein Cas5 (RAMP superfamily)
MGREVNEEKRAKFIEFAGKRVNNVLHDIQILEPMARSNSYDFTKQDVDDMFNAIQDTLNEAREEFNKKFEEKARAEKKVFSFANSASSDDSEDNINGEISNDENI